MKSKIGVASCFMAGLAVLIVRGAAAEGRPADPSLGLLAEGFASALAAAHPETRPVKVVNTGVREIVLVEGRNGIFSNASANAVPEGVDPAALSGCRFGEELGGFEANAVLGKYHNKVRFRISYQYGCSLDGSGRYLKGINVVPEQVSIGEPYYVRVVAYFREPYMNDHAAYMNVTVAMTISHSGQTQSASQSFLLTGL